MYEDIQREERENSLAEKKSQKRWRIPVAGLAIALFGAVCFGTGFAVAYFAVPCAGRYILKQQDIEFKKKTKLS